MQFGKCCSSEGGRSEPKVFSDVGCNIYSKEEVVFGSGNSKISSLSGVWHVNDDDMWLSVGTRQLKVKPV